MGKHSKLLIVGAAVAALAAGGAGLAQAVGAGEDEPEPEALAGPSPDRAKAAALRITGGGTANSVERDSENGATWEVEVTRPRGITVDVRLDRDFKLVVVEADSEKPDDREERDSAARE